MKHPPLNPAQKKAVEHFTGPILVLAGAGSGKTRVITHRIARLVERGVPVKSIVALTFTNKAAAEMRERVVSLLKAAGSKQTSDLAISTFHSFGLGVLQRERIHVMGQGAFTIFDQGDCLGAIKEILSRLEYGKKFDAAVIQTRISNAKNAFVLPEDLEEREGDDYDAVTKLVYPKYQSALRSFRAFDFDDLVCEVARVWRAKPDVLAKWQDRCRFLLVDEYQDTNRAQLEMLRLLAGDQKNVCVVGDDDQSIYGWRGADVRNILEFEDHFAGAEVVKLEQNYRSTKPILDVANAVISKRPDVKHKKTLFTELAGGRKVAVRVAPTPEDEASWVGREIRRVVKEEGVRAREVAVLYRSNGQAKLIEEALRDQNVPHRLIGGQQFYERKEVKDLLSYLKLVFNRQDEISLRRVINYPPRGIGETSVERLATHAVAKGWSMWQAIERVDALDGIPATARDGCKALEKILAETRRQLMVDREKPSVVARSLCDRIGLRRELDVTSGSVAASGRRWSNVESLLLTFTKREIKATNAGADVAEGFSQFLHVLTLDFGAEEGENAETVTLSTLHGAKGLEFDVVYLIGCEEGLLPHSRTLDSRATDQVPDSAANAPVDVEEERRLFYVGVTRAKQRLTMTRSRTRPMRGKMMARTPSRFLADVPEDLVDVQDVKGDVALSPQDLAARANALLAKLNELG